MIPLNSENNYLFEKLKNSIVSCKPIYNTSETGAFLIIANYKVLHARAIMNMQKDMATEIASSSSITTTPRLLYRSKGPRTKLQLP